MTGKLAFEFPEILTAFGLPARLASNRAFTLRNALGSIELNQTMIPVSRQINWFTTMMTEDSGWCSYFLSAGDLRPMKVLAANIMRAYWLERMGVRWITNFDKLDKVPFREMRLVVIDALFADAASFRRDKIYEILNYHCNRTDISVIVLAQNDLGGAIRQLGTKPDFALQMKG